MYGGSSAIEAINLCVPRVSVVPSTPSPAGMYLRTELPPYTYTIIAENPYPSMDTPLNFS
ncbi:MAG: hypothetical protein ACKO8H_07640 [Microcystis panniformis]